MNGHFYHTIPQDQKSHADSEQNAKRQEDKIYEYMRNNGGEWTAWQLKTHFPDLEITSIRRALWNLENKDKKIRQTGWQDPGPKGVKVGRFQVIWLEPAQQTKLF